MSKFKITPETPRDWVTFVNQVKDANLHIEGYERRYGDERPATRVNNILELQDVIRLTTPMLDWDTLGEGWIVYPMYR